MINLSVPSNLFRSFFAAESKGIPKGIALFALLFFVGCCFLDFCPPASAAESRSERLRFEEIVPADTILFAKVSGIDQFLADRETLDLFKIWAESEVQAFIADSREMIPNALGMKGEPKFPCNEAWSLLRGEISLACTSRSTIVGNIPFPSTALALDMGDNHEAFLGSVKSLIEIIVLSKKLEKGSFEYRGQEIGFFGLPLKRWTINYTTIKNLFVITFSRYYLQDIIDTHLDGKPLLADDPSFMRSLARMGGDNVRMAAFLNIRSIGKMLHPFCPYDAEQWIKLLGLDRINALCLGTSVEKGGSRDSIFIDAPGEKKGLFKAFSPCPVSRENMSRAWPDTLLFLDFVVDFEQVLSEADGFIKKAFPEFSGEFQKGLAQFRKETGFDLERDILGPLGKEFSLFLKMPSQGGLAVFPDVIMSMSLDDEESFMGVQKKLLAMLEQGNVQVITSEFGGRSLHYIKLPVQVPFSPTFTVADGRLIAASSTMTMRKYLKWLEKGDPGLSGSEAFKDALADVPEGASALAYIDLKKAVGIAYGSGSQFLPGILAESGLPLDAGLLPMTETITEHLSNDVGYLVVDEDGICLSKRCPFGLSALVSAAVSIADYLVQNDLVHGLMARKAASEETVQVRRQDDPELGKVFLLIQDQKHDLAEKRLTAWIDSHSDQDWSYVLALTYRGDCRMNLGQYSDAVDDYLIVAERDKKSRGRACYNICRAYAFMNETDKAIPFLEEAIIAGYRMFEIDADLECLKDDPRFGIFFDMVTTASGLMREGEYEKAEQLFTEWIYNNPYHGLAAWAMKNRGDCLFELGCYEEAVTDYKNVAKRNDDYKPDVFYSTACACAIMNKPDRAIQYLEMAVQAGFSDFDLMDCDGDLDSIRDNPKFKSLRWTW